MNQPKFLSYVKSLEDQLNNTGDEAIPLLPVQVGRNGCILTFHFIPTVESPEIQRFKIAVQNRSFINAARSTHRRIEKQGIDISDVLNIELPKTKAAEWSFLEKVKVYEAVAKLKEPDLSTDRTLSQLNIAELASYYAHLFIETLQLNERYYVTCRMYFLTGAWCLPSSVMVRVDERGEIAICVDESASINLLRAHWDIIDNMKALLIPEPRGRKSYFNDTRDIKIYGLYRDGVSSEEIMRVCKIRSEDAYWKIINRMKKKTKDSY